MNENAIKCQANVKAKNPADLDVCGKPAVEALIEGGDYIPLCRYHVMVARRSHWAVGRLRNDRVEQ